VLGDELGLQRPGHPRVRPQNERHARSSRSVSIRVEDIVMSE
jgi:hypothetical protein